VNVLVIPEDFRKDQFVLQPLVQAMFKEIGKPHAKVRICMDPNLGGVDQALTWDRIEEILDRYRGFVNVFLLLVDRDGVPERRAALDRLEQRAATFLAAHGHLLGENAWQEIEVWALAGQPNLPWAWQDIRDEPNSKERYFRLYASGRGLLDEPGEGRRTLGREAAQNYRRVRALCKEDVEALELRLRAL
jgi:hypothetical protein